MKKSGEISFETKVGIVKKIFITISIFIGIILFILLMLQSIVKLNKYKDAVNKGVAAIIQENLKNNKLKLNSSFEIKGDISFRSFPSPHIVVNNISAQNLTWRKYILNFRIQKLKLFLSTKNLFLRKLTITKAEFSNSNFNLQEVKGIENQIVEAILQKYSEKFINKNRDIAISLKNNSLAVKGLDYTRNFSNANLVGMYTKNKFNLTGSTLSNKQSLNLDVSITKRNDTINSDIDLNSFAFKSNINFSFDKKLKKVNGKARFNILNPQVFVRTVFSPESTLFKRIIDNSNLNINSEFTMDNNILNISKIDLRGTNIIGSGTVTFDFNQNSKNNVKFNISSANLDNLIIKNMSGKTDSNINENNISIFSGVKREVAKNSTNISYIEKMLELNPTNFDIDVKTLKLNQQNVLNTKLNFIYSAKGKKVLDFEKVSSELPGGTTLLIENKNENDDALILRGNDSQEFISFLRNTKVSDTSKKESFEFKGIIETNNGIIFIKDATYKSPEIETKNNIEIKLDSGISYLAIDTVIDNLNLENFIPNLNKNKAETYVNSFKNQILFLNNFTLTSYLKFTINNIKFKDFQDNDYQFILKTSQGILDIYNINLNNKVLGDIALNILSTKPLINVNLKLSDININKNIDFNKIVFDLPMFNGIYGNIKISGNNLKFKNSPINSLIFDSKITNGAINISNFNIDGFGGKCKVSGFLNLLYSKKLNLTFSGCTADLSYLLYPFTGTNNISGMVGFSSVLYTEGIRLDNFINNYILKTDFIGSGITINGFGLSTLSSNLFDINSFNTESNEELLNKINSESVLYNPENKTVFEKISNGNIQYSKIGGGQISFDISRPMINGKIAMDFRFIKDAIEIMKGNANFTLLSGTIRNTIPLTILIAMSGSTTKPNIVSNLTQVDSYINSVREEYEKAKARVENN